MIVARARTHHTPRSSTCTAVVVLAVLFAVGVGVTGQQAPNRLARDSSDDGRAHAEKGVVESMSSHHMHDNPHLKVTTKWPEQPGDHQRAIAIVAALKPALARYRDYHQALRNGYGIFMPEVSQPVYHFTNYLEGFAETFRFQPDQATSLLYRKTRTGYELVGAMYTAPADASELDLDARVPLSITQWHEHINICLPPRGTAATADWTKFGPDGSISTADACVAGGGRFVKQLFGWMVHVYPFEKTFDRIWSMEPGSPGR
jgi:hypothetical protein